MNAPGQVDAKSQLPMLERLVEERRAVPNTGVVDEDVDAAEAGDGRVN